MLVIIKLLGQSHIGFKKITYYTSEYQSFPAYCDTRRDSKMLLYSKLSHFIENICKLSSV